MFLVELRSSGTVAGRFEVARYHFVGGKRGILHLEEGVSFEISGEENFTKKLVYLGANDTVIITPLESDDEE